ncbi:MAG: hypothetical protein RMK84_20675, partial [Oscillochloridaceae bacterium]|nr:hypothetical protein [Oscillochloridaceae bacterium]
QGRIAALQDAQIDTEAEEELARIEQRLGLRPAPATDSVAASATASVDDSEALKELEELERKLQAAQGEGNKQSGA